MTAIRVAQSAGVAVCGARRSGDPAGAGSPRWRDNPAVTERPADLKGGGPRYQLREAAHTARRRRVPHLSGKGTSLLVPPRRAIRMAALAAEPFYVQT